MSAAYDEVVDYGDVCTPLNIRCAPCQIADGAATVCYCWFKPRQLLFTPLQEERDSFGARLVAPGGPLVDTFRAQHQGVVGAAEIVSRDL